MNYRHAFHAGNHADVFKHVVLSRLIALLCQKETPFAYLDTHSGLGIYDLYSSEAERTGEWLEGIKLLLEQANTPELFDDYITVINQLNVDKKLQYYPGSPMLAQKLMRPQDRIIFNEKHPEDAQLLKQNFRKDSRITIHTQDGWLLPKALLPTTEKRLLLLIDPPFEQTNELDLCVKSLTDAIARMRQAIVAIWYPIKDQKNLNKFYNQLKMSNAPKLLKAELMIKPADNNLGLNGSGMVIANPPWKLENELTTLLSYLSNVLTENAGTWSIDWLIAESVK
ncbi:23S rRNA (adenine(2030)-N(6))-methyltransferase RlmJ [Entomomonas sp. E2T0]|uniref:23S rRNA (adenine(2030)-N(6))-methyltransferase RlmJ n=1 Tax=Entomomonas sp. E2T0 TaxID=2930213 RepID=UPI0022284523|nr:23S rRNA (adenine(2030)-N(6))-methyltransferase RlmJ [Entomomonas sp. E2T0]UYZ84520.1 23S rRNA (adenine(2030)-N(6))-methyltransferase RlmJ [Entomomonas sp. E2T0]